MVFPDVCKVPAPPAPPIPTPFPNIGQVSSAKKTSSKVKICKKGTVTKKSEIGSTNGDEAGTLKGLISSTTGSKAVYRMASSKVKVEGAPIETAMKMTAHNGSNPNAPPGSQIAPSQTKVIIMG